jgi:1-phosphofructokinase family hexose kinase
MSEAGTAGHRERLLFIAANPSIDRLYEVDRLAVGEIHRPRSVVTVPGGKGLNAARAAAALGGRVTVATIVAGRAGDWIAEALARLGIDTQLASSIGETRTCVSIVDRSSGGLTEIYEYGEEIEVSAWDSLEAIVSAELRGNEYAAVALSGSLPRGAPPDGFRRIARLAAIAGPQPIPVLADTYGPALGALLAERPAIVKINAAEAGEASGISVTDVVSAAAAAAVLRDAGAGSVVVTLGLEGAVVVGSEERARLVPPSVRGPYPVGSGDAFLGGLAVAHARGEAIVESARFGLAAGIANAQVPGAGILDATAIEPILRQIVSIPI